MMLFALGCLGVLQLARATHSPPQKHGRIAILVLAGVVLVYGIMFHGKTMLEFPNSFYQIASTTVSIDSSHIPAWKIRPVSLLAAFETWWCQSLFNAQ